MTDIQLLRSPDTHEVTYYLEVIGGPTVARPARSGVPGSLVIEDVSVTFVGRNLVSYALIGRMPTKRGLSSAIYADVYRASDPHRLVVSWLEPALSLDTITRLQTRESYRSERALGDASGAA